MWNVEVNITILSHHKRTNSHMHTPPSHSHTTGNVLQYVLDPEGLILTRDHLPFENSRNPKQPFTLWIHYHFNLIAENTDTEMPYECL